MHTSIKYAVDATENHSQDRNDAFDIVYNQVKLLLFEKLSKDIRGRLEGLSASDLYIGLRELESAKESAKHEQTKPASDGATGFRETAGERDQDSASHEGASRGSKRRKRR